MSLFLVLLLKESLCQTRVFARLEGKSSLGRIGLLIHSTAGFVDPGFAGYLTLELSNVANLPIKIYPEMKIGQISFYYLNSPSESEYGSEPTEANIKDKKGLLQVKAIQILINNDSWKFGKNC
ncbi:MAG: hypothetical protein Ct9H90mP22_6820 [Gammaproteobacteria bacterium]|nr:MAG: hypothetical protein Ct9H90mP22_6820 [Gammaproteobacteria bacterium]